MPRSARDVPPPLELSCLTALWSIEEGNVKDVQRIVGRSRPLAYTTIMTVLDSAGIARLHAASGDSRTAGRFLRRVGGAVDAISADAGGPCRSGGGGSGG